MAAEGSSPTRVRRRRTAWVRDVGVDFARDVGAVGEAVAHHVDVDAPLQGKVAQGGSGRHG